MTTELKHIQNANGIKHSDVILEDLEESPQIMKEAEIASAGSSNNEP